MQWERSTSETWLDLVFNHKENSPMYMCLFQPHVKGRLFDCKAKICV